jgi:hypothetical protein
VASLALIALSVLLVMLETVEEIEARYDTLFFVLEWIITILFHRHQESVDTKRPRAQNRIDAAAGLSASS